ncbi:uncharacterized protein CTRU02_212424 [Colletotrichum truncatum]|uniref:Uncharacterized protein n=1 Tax=Colletotrichum truncatum TaxID=5467 RepID=A0ACC3YNK9_COLTU|nr:uncharacterized protein CTRU02_08704 [Colletotrichum truncatum]KAF6789457.1 hypothetical protein CTRU02_08704 [Colletotrichum truncatum]
MKVTTTFFTLFTLASTVLADGCFFCAERKGGIVCTTPGPGAASHGCGWCCDTADQCIRLVDTGVCK